jgi:hypothetical protein
MLKIATIEEVENYYTREALSQSFLKNLEGDLDKLLEEKSSSGFKGGKLVDTMLLSHPEDFHKLYHVSLLENLPSEAMQKMLKKLVEIAFADYVEQINVITTPVIEEATKAEQDELFPALDGNTFIDYAKDMSLFSHYILAICQESEWNNRWGNDAKINAFLKENDYFQDLVKSQGKTIISSEDYEKAKNFCQKISSHLRTARFFDKELFASSDLLDVYYQLPIYFKYRGHNCKALLDIVFVEYEFYGEERVLKEITPIDLKSTGQNTYYFPQQVSSYRYDVQAAWYTLALAKHFNLPEDTTLINPFMFVVNSFSNSNKPATFVLSEQTILAGKQGVTIGNKVYKGYEDFIDLYDFYCVNGFTEEKEFVQSANNPIQISLQGYVKENTIW